MSAPAATLARANLRLMRKLVVIATAMFAFGFVLAPLYEKICQATGLRSILRADHLEARNTQVDTARDVAVEFDTNTRNLPWTFRPLTPYLALHPGEMQQVVFEVRNTLDRPVTGQAIPSYGPQQAASYFKKVQCFCFEQQTLGPGEVRQMPVVFVVDPELPRDINTITLSFTFFEVENPPKKAPS